VAEAKESNNASAGFAHVGVTVDDLDEAIDWYCQILGLQLLAEPVEVSSSDARIGDQVRDVFGRDVSFRQAHLLLADGTALELFEFTDPAVRRATDRFAFGETGFWHICLYRRDVDEIVSRIAESKGRVRNSKIWEVIPGEPYKMCYCEDPSGNVVEIYSHSHAEVFGGRQGYEQRQAEDDG
jgi:catechol 2,3-dioxygenase-like lactoylglutathione lyase family enzyme